MAERGRRDESVGQAYTYFSIKLYNKAQLSYLQHFIRIRREKNVPTFASGAFYPSRNKIINPYKTILVF